MSRYCYNCNKITAGEPLFCQFCGRTYNVKLCSRLHPNPRTAQVCSQCGSRDMSTPQPKVPLWVPILELILQAIPGSLLTLVSVVAVVLFLLAILTRPALLLATIALLAALGFLWWAWSQIPISFRRAVSTLLMHRRQDSRGRQKH